MPKELPGFYYDSEKNRYFPYKGRFPGSSSSKPSPIPPTPPKQVVGLFRRSKLRAELLQARELCGSIISSCKTKKLSFQAEYQKRQVSQPAVWGYKGTRKKANSLEHLVADVILPHGVVERDILLSGGLNGSLCVFQVGKDRGQFDPTEIYKEDSVWPHSPNRIPRHEGLLRHIWDSPGSFLDLASEVSRVVSRKSSPQTDDAISKHAVNRITTLGSASTPGCVCILDLSKPLDFFSLFPIAGLLHEIAHFYQTLWTADCDPEGTRAAVGTSKGVAMLDIETKQRSWVLSSKSDALSVQFDQSGKSILCGLRNGSISTVDARQKQIRRAHTHSTISMPSSVCSLVSLKQWDQYFLASSMDGSIRLYDHRLTQRGPVQSYEGNVNSHTCIDLGVDPSEKVVMSGGEDCYLRLWNIKSGEMLFNERFKNTVPSAICWPKTGGDTDEWLTRSSRLAIEFTLFMAM
ncbi:hypothetical protein CASFOL_039029 [Castilleja foliolosa]|uniref:Uncharacterized protein n=1 Tax=Castilleja foliolosa TaxID=1961234 RepID=A0ABD3BGV6_9LAMI